MPSLSRRNAVTDRRPLCPYRPDPAQAGFDIFARTTSATCWSDPRRQGRAHPHRGLHLRRQRARWCATCWSRSGRPMPPASTTIPPTGRTSRSIRVPRLGPRRAPTSRPALGGFDTVKPGAGRRAARAAGDGAARQLLDRRPRHQYRTVNTRMYFADEAEANAEDPVLNIIEQPPRRQTLMARRAERDGTSSIRSTSTCRAIARPSSSTSDRRIHS